MGFFTKTRKHTYNDAQTDPAEKRARLREIDESLARNSCCDVCTGNVELTTVETNTTYTAWLVCTNPKCGHRRKLN